MLNKPSRRGFPVFIVVTLMTLSALACNLMPLAEATATPVGGIPFPTVADTTRPQVFIESPVSGAQAVVRQPFSLKIRAVDAVGITRVEVREGRRVVIQQPSPDPVTNFEALLPYTPTNTGNVTLEAVAYRRGTPSEPASVTIQVVASADQLSNPGALDATSGVAPGGTGCVVRVSVNNLNLRQGPGTTYAILGKLALGEGLTVTGRNALNTWYQVRRANTTSGWVSAEYVSPESECGTVPVVNPPPG